ncbi:MAG TPA: MFS transporter, partial [Gammaproteobacteria bacterium]|nr:MFS transporter [Gammaproteobacteria bacterium]
MDATTAAPTRGGASPWPVTIAVMLGTLMVILDMTIVNVSLPHMMGSLGATSEQITWVLTSYIVAEAVMIPLSGFLANRFGRRNVILVSIVGFVIASGLCGQADTLTEMVIFRILQGIFGAPVIPLSQSTLLDTFPAQERGKAMAIFGIGVLMAPALGPTLGGYITEHWDWRWVFYINLPVGIVNILLAYAVLPDTEHRKQRIDLFGAFCMVIGIGALQYVLDQGNHENWFESRVIVYGTVLAALTLLVFTLRSWNRPDSVLQLNLLRDRNLATGSFLMMCFGLGLFGTIVLQPILLQELLGYPASTTGLVMAPRALCNAVTM